MNQINIVFNLLHVEKILFLFQIGILNINLYEQINLHINLNNNIFFKF